MKANIIDVTYKYLKENYDYLWLKTRLHLAKTTHEKWTLIVGSSHALNGIDTYCFNNAINCSMHTQDIGYDNKCVKQIIGEEGKIREAFLPEKCFIIFGYYIPFQDISLGSGEYTQNMLRFIYNPVFDGKDEITWDKVIAGISDNNILQEDKEVIYHRAYNMVLVRKNYYSDLTIRCPLQQFKGKWKDLPEEQRMEYAIRRADDHNKHIHYKASYEKNKVVLKDTIGMLDENEIKAVIVIPPYTKAYNSYIDKNMKQATKDMILDAGKNADFLDMNEIDAGFCDDDFVDTDHLNGRGAYKLSMYLTGKYGK